MWDEPFGDEGARAISNEILSHPDLFVALSLDTTEVTVDGAAHLARMLKGTTSLEVVGRTASVSCSVFMDFFSTLYCFI